MLLFIVIDMVIYKELEIAERYQCVFSGVLRCYSKKV